MRGAVVVLALLVCAALAASALAGAANPSTVKIGILLPLTGPFAAVAETQRNGAMLAIEQVNEKGGLRMPWGRVRVEGVVADDEAKLDVGVRRYRYLVEQGVVGVVGQTWAPLAYAINAVVKREPMPYFPVCVMAKEAFERGKLADTTFAVTFSPWTVGYMAGSAAIQVLGKKRIFFLARADSWGWDMRDGTRAAAEKFGAQIVGYDEVPLGTTDFTTVLQKVRAARPDVFISAQFAADAVALLKQTYQMGLNREMTIFNAFITNVVAKGLPPEALKDVYAMHYFYYDLDRFLGGSPVAKSAQTYTQQYQARYRTPPDAYATIAYTAMQEMFRGFEQSGSLEPGKVAAALMAKPIFQTVKGPAQWRKDHSVIYRFAAFLVKGKGPGEQRHEWDLFQVVGAQGGEEVLPPLKALGY
ncbi:MAG: ABC transporter substrate-binding protein [Armatimonadota bacterium]|nr:ABC transporter substrate-binding protein [Armatimonadota bacterium]MDR7385911.1 ABC transporter substrate-binding protein [Armatimonadota bacterium]MDR7389946.1 ABC transporter substrate-binding protein [Armatimonadota bacterium]MDR7395766.1 ABC transporter substrate-binding protein [Armatimonadota bacterium]MDR7398980.1 ABC transporter substrate-binding protein [Armatimonadota bacterium]